MKVRISIIEPNFSIVIKYLIVFSKLMDASSRLEYRDSRRWIVMLAFSTLSFSTAMGVVNLNGIPLCAVNYYGR
jgi:hypothetical protein